LRTLRSEQAAERLKLGLGKDPDDALVFRTIEGAPLVPNSITTEWRRLVSFSSFRRSRYTLGVTRTRAS